MKFELTEQEKEEIVKQAKEDLIQITTEYTERVWNGSGLSQILDVADEMLKKHPELTYDDIEVDAWEEPIEWETGTDIVMGLSCPSKTPEALEQRIKALEERELYDKDRRYKTYLELQKEFDDTV
jgi:hypothetical protein